MSDLLGVIYERISLVSLVYEISFIYSVIVDEMTFNGFETQAI